VPPGIADATVPNPIFSLTPSATVDEGNNWINISWGPLAMANPVTGTTLGNYAPGAGSPVINAGISGAIPGSGGVVPPSTDFFGKVRTPPYDIGAIEVGAAAGVAPPTLESISPISAVRGSTLEVTLTGLNLSGATAVNVTGGAGVTVSGVIVQNPTTVTATFTVAANAALGPSSVSVTTPGGASNAMSFRVTGASVAFSAITPLLTTAPATTTTKTGTITVRNNANGANAGPLILTATPTVTRTAGLGTFTVTGGTCVSGFVVDPGANCTVTVQYAPGTSTATSRAYITVTDTGAATASQNSGNFNGN
jgi:hypothetical protein